MKKDVFYFVQDAYGYLVSTDETGFNASLSIWKQNDCNFNINKKVYDSYITVKLWRI